MSRKSASKPLPKRLIVIPHSYKLWMGYPGFATVEEVFAEVRNVKKKYSEDEVRLRKAINDLGYECGEGFKTDQLAYIYWVHSTWKTPGQLTEFFKYQKDQFELDQNENKEEDDEEEDDENEEEEEKEEEKGLPLTLSMLNIVRTIKLL